MRVDLNKGVIDNDVFSESAYKMEMEHVFGKTWVFVGHESIIPNPGDYFTSYLGEDPVIVVRDSEGRIGVFLNKCLHRGNRVCLFDRGNTSSFACTYHGWTYGTDGSLSGVPFFDEAYYGELDKNQWGLAKIPKVANYGGLIFASWNPDVVPIETYLGDARWYLDNFLLRDGLEVRPGKQRYLMPVNWKLLAENFAGDQYHVYATHTSVFRIVEKYQDSRLANLPTPKVRKQGQTFSVVANYGTGAPHGFLELRVGDAFYQHDLDIAQKMGREAVEWVEERHRRLQERLQDVSVKPYSFHIGNLFPNFSLIGIGTAFDGKGLIVWQPKGPNMTEVWQWCAVEKDAPKLVKDRANLILMQTQSAAGIIAPDDHENYERLSDNIRTAMAKKFPFNYEMGIGHEREDPRPAEWNKEEWPGLITTRFSEAMQRDYYRHWTQLMKSGGTDV